MKYKENWDKTMERFQALWKRELIDRCCISVTAPKEGKSNVIQPAPADPDERIRYWTDGEFIAARFRQSFENTLFAGDAFPRIPIFLGAAGCAGFFKNVKYQLGDSTVWFFPYVENYEDGSIVFDADSFLYRKTMDLARYLADEARGDYIVAMPDLSGTADALAHMRGSENFLMDMYDAPENVHKALQMIQDVRLNVSRQVYELVRDNNYGGCSVGWLHTWGPGWHDQMQCDLAAMISPPLFQEFIMPELTEQANAMDIPLYHFDGREQIRHLDMLLSIEQTAAIQWTCVAGQPSPLEFVPVLRKIQQAGKILIVYAKAQEVGPLMEQLSSRGLFLIVQADSEAEAMEIEKEAAKLTRE